MAGKAHKHLNVFQKPLLPFSKEPMTGFYRNGSCEVGPEDKGNHAIAATLTDSFLDFSASRGNDLRSIPGLKAGGKWCLCVNRWKEAVDYAEKNGGKDGLVPKVHLHATNKSALDGVDLGVLKKYAAEGEANNASNVAQGEGGMKGAVKESSEMSSKGSMTSRQEQTGAQ